MMLGMGWTGGALGSRGDGITEPIMPHLDGVAGAGLGHVKAPKQTQPLPKVTPPVPTLGASSNKRNQPRFRQVFLAQLLELIKSDNDTATIKFFPIIKKKEKSFVRHAMRSFAARTPLNMAPEEQIIVDKIRTEYDKDPELLVYACIGEGNKEIVFRKKRNAVATVNKNECSREVSDEALLADDVQLLFDGHGPLCQSSRSYNNGKFRTSVLIELLRFLKCDHDMTFQMKFESQLKAKQKTYIEKTVEKINDRLKFGATGLEAAVSLAIRRNIGNVNLTIQFGDDNMSFHAFKDYNKKSRQKVATTTATYDNNSDLEVDTVAYESDDLYIEDDMKILSDKRKQINKPNYVVYKNTEISEKDDEYAIEIADDIKNTVNHLDYSDDKSDNIRNIPKNDEDIVVEYDDGITHFNETNAESDIKKPWSDYTGISLNMETPNPVKPVHKNKRLLEKKRDNSMVVSSRILESITNVTGINNYTTNEDTTAEVLRTKQSSPEVIIESDDSDNTLASDNVVDKMSISDQSHLDYSVLGIDDISMSDEKLTDWDGKNDNSDDSDDLTHNNNIGLKNNNTVSTFSEFKRKQLKKKSQKSNINIKIVSLNKRFVSPKVLLKYIQRIVSYNIIQSEQLPLLKCYGIHKDGLYYSCHDQKTYDWLLDVCVANQITMLNQAFDKMSFKINWFYDIDDSYVFDMLDIYNKNISTNEWSILKREETDDGVLFYVKMDKQSFQFILESDLSLYAGVDKVQFNIVWE